MDEVDNILLMTLRSAGHELSQDIKSVRDFDTDLLVKVRRGEKNGGRRAAPRAPRCPTDAFRGKTVGGKTTNR